MSDEPPENPESLNSATILMMIFLGVSVPFWILLQFARMSAEHGRYFAYWLSIQIGWLYLPAVALGFTRVLRRRSSEGQLVELLLPPSVVLLALFLLSLFGGLFRIRGG